MEQVKRKRHFSFRCTHFFSFFDVCVCMFIRSFLCVFSLSVICLFSALHLYYSHAIYRIKYSSLTFPIRFKACYFYVFTFVVVAVVCSSNAKLCCIFKHTKKNTHTQRPTTHGRQWAPRKKKLYQLYLVRWNLYKKQLKMLELRWVGWLVGSQFFFCEYVSVCEEKNIYPSHANSVQIEKYVLLMTANGFNRA